MPTWSAENELKVQANPVLQFSFRLKLIDANMKKLATAIIALHQVKVSKDDCDRLATIVGDGELKQVLHSTLLLSLSAAQAARLKRSPIVSRSLENTHPSLDSEMQHRRRLPLHQHRARSGDAKRKPLDKRTSRLEMKLRQRSRVQMMRGLELRRRRRRRR